MNWDEWQLLVEMSGSLFLVLKVIASIILLAVPPLSKLTDKLELRGVRVPPQ